MFFKNRDSIYPLLLHYVLHIRLNSLPMINAIDCDLIAIILASQKTNK